MTQTTTTADAVLKEFYLPTLRVQLNQNFPILEAVSKNTEDFEGRRAVLSLHVGRSGGVGAGAEMQDLPEAGYQDTAEQRIGVKRQRARIKVSVDAMKASKSDAGSFVRALDLETKGIINDAKNDVARQVFGTSDGVIAAATSEAAGVITLTSPTATQMRQFHKNMRVDVGTVANPTLRGSGLVITAVDRSAGTITVSGTISGVTTADRVFRSGAGGAGVELTGLQTIVADSGVLHNVDPSADDVWKSTVLDNGGTARAFTDNLVERIIDDVMIESGEMPDVIWTTHGAVRNFAAQLKGQKRFDAPATRLAGGYEAPTVTTPSGEIGMVADRYAPEGQAFALNTSHLMEFVLEDWDFMDEDGAVLSRVPNKAAYEATLLKFHELATDMRNSHGLIKDLSES